jgi:hypothetical protein
VEVHSAQPHDAIAGHTDSTGGCVFQSVSERPSDEAIIRQLGAAVLLFWHDLPFVARGQILAQANDVIGIQPVSRVRDHIEKLLLRRAPRE